MVEGESACVLLRDLRCHHGQHRLLCQCEPARQTRRHPARGGPRAASFHRGICARPGAGTGLCGLPRGFGGRTIRHGIEHGEQVALRGVGVRYGKQRE